MSLKQISPEKRIMFLKQFTQKLIFFSIKEEQTKEIIETEKLKQKFIQPNITSEQAIQETIQSSAFEPSRYPIKEHPQETKPSLAPVPIKQKPYPIPPKQSLPKPFLKRLKKKVRKQHIKTISSDELQTKSQALQQIQPQYHPKPVGFNLGKIEVFLKDPLLQSIECPGPRKNILIKKQNRISPTRMIISQQEINDIINSFSQKAKIPIMGGILKAAVGNLIISAVISEFVGSRFIITKINPPLSKNPIQSTSIQPVTMQSNQTPFRN